MGVNDLNEISVKYHIGCDNQSSSRSKRCIWEVES
jgi:hypothetical protein